MKKRVPVFWLLPAESEAELFRSLIKILGNEFKAPLFAPHLTLGKAGTIAAAKKQLRAMAAGPVRVRIRGIAHSPRFTKTLFIRLAPNRSLENLAAELGCEGVADPHVSLIYKTLPSSARRELAAAIKLPLRGVTFDGVALMNLVSPTETGADVRAWRKIASQRLAP
jgi:hypothetical protein